MTNAIEMLNQSIREWDEKNNILYTFIPKKIIHDLMIDSGHNHYSLKDRRYGIYVLTEGTKPISLVIEYDALLIMEQSDYTYKVKKCCTWLSAKTGIKKETIIDAEVKNSLVAWAVSYALSYCLAQKLSPEDIFSQLPELKEINSIEGLSTTQGKGNSMILFKE